MPFHIRGYSWVGESWVVDRFEVTAVQTDGLSGDLQQIMTFEAPIDRSDAVEAVLS